MFFNHSFENNVIQAGKLCSASLIKLSPEYRSTIFLNPKQAQNINICGLCSEFYHIQFGHQTGLNTPKNLMTAIHAVLDLAAKLPNINVYFLPSSGHTGCPN